MLIIYRRHRSPTFSKDEVKLLINLIDKYKTIILNKSTSTAACHAKEVTWSKITKVYNSHGFKHARNIDCLKVKWDNLKREARKISKNLMEIKHNEFNDVTSQIVSMICEAENNNSEVEVPQTIDEDLIGIKSLIKYLFHKPIGGKKINILNTSNTNMQYSIESQLVF